MPTNLRVETPREAMVMGRYALVFRASGCEMVRRKKIHRGQYGHNRGGYMVLWQSCPSRGQVTSSNDLIGCSR